MKKSGKIIGLILLVLILLGIGLFIQTRIRAPEKLFKATINEINNEISEESSEKNVGYFISRLRYIVDNYPKSRWADDAQRILADLYTGWDYEKAIEEKRKIIKKFPDAKWEEWTLKNSPVPIYYFGGPKKKTAQYPADALAQFEIAFIYYRDLKNYQKAIEESQKAIDAFPNVKPSDKGTFSHVIVCYHTIAKSYKALGDSEKAEETYQTIIDRFPGTKVAQIAQKKIEELKSQL